MRHYSLNKLGNSNFSFLLLIALLTSVLVATELQLFAFLLLLILSLASIAGFCRYVLQDQLSPSNYQKFLKYLIYIFIFHLLIGLTIFHIKPLETYIGSDASEYDTGASGLVNHWTLGYPMPTTLIPGKAGYFYLLASIYWIFGYFPNLGILFNNACFSIAVIFLASVTRSLSDDTSTIITLLIAGFTPGFIIWGSQLLREPVIYLCLAISLWSTTRFITSSRLRYILYAGASLSALVTLRSDVAFLAGGGLFLALSYSLAIKNKNMAKGLATTTSMVLIAILLVALTGSVGYEGIKIVTSANLNTLNTIRQSSATASSGFLGSYTITSFGAALKFLPLGLASFLLGPFPWQIHSIRELPAIPDTVTWWILIAFGFRGLSYLHKNHKGILPVLITPAILLALGLSLIIANYGTAVRERMQVIIFFLPILSIGIGLKILSKHKRHLNNLIEYENLEHYPNRW